MRMVILEGRRFTDRPAANAYLQQALALPAWYGRDPDALADCIGTWGADTLLILQDPAAVERRLGDYGTRLLAVLEALGNRPGGFLYLTQK